MLFTPIRYEDGDKRWYEQTENGLRSLQKRARDPVASCTETPSPRPPDTSSNSISSLIRQSSSVSVSDDTGGLAAKRFWRDTFRCSSGNSLQANAKSTPQNRSFVLRCDFDIKHKERAGTGANSIHSDSKFVLTFLFCFAHSATSAQTPDVPLSCYL